MGAKFAEGRFFKNGDRMEGSRMKTGRFTLAAIAARLGVTVQRHRTGSLFVCSHDPDPLLWRAVDYAVSTRSGPVLWFTPRYTPGYHGVPCARCKGSGRVPTSNVLPVKSTAPCLMCTRQKAEVQR